jgi:WD40 repeat protein
VDSSSGSKKISDSITDLAMKRILLITLLATGIRGIPQKVNDFTDFNTESKIIYDICFTDKGEVLGIADNKTIKAYSAEDNDLINEFKGGHKGQILSIDISKDSSLLISGGKDSLINIWDFFTGQIIKSLNCHKGIITEVKISPCSNYLASGGTDCKVFIYDLNKNQIICEFNDHKDDVTSLAFNPACTMLASASADKTIKIYNLISGKLITSLTGHKNWVRDLSWSPDGTRLISCGDDSRIIIWNVRNIDNIYIQTNSRIDYGWLLSVQFHEYNNTYTTGGTSGKAWIIMSYNQNLLKIKYPINKILLKPNEGMYLKIALATFGKGVIMVNADRMKIKGYI